jgi:hypothetical protein
MRTRAPALLRIVSDQRVLSPEDAKDADKDKLLAGRVEAIVTRLRDWLPHQTATVYAAEVGVYEDRHDGGYTCFAWVELAWPTLPPVEKP